MKSMITAGLLGVLLFGVSAGVSWFFIFPPEDPTEEEMVEEDASLHEFPPKVAEEDQVEEMPVAHRPESLVTVEAVTELAQSIMKKERALFDAEKRLEQRRKNLQLLNEDVQRERELLEAFAKEVDAKIQQAAEAAELLDIKRKGVENQVGVLSKLERKTGKTTADVAEDELQSRVKKVKDWFAKLEPATAASHLKEFANRGEIEFASRLLNSLNDRDIPRVLTAIDDPPLIAQFVDSITKDRLAAGESKTDVKRR